MVGAKVNREWQTAENVTVVNTVGDSLARSGFGVRVEQETSYFDRNSPLG